jgi:molecular chaperone DnaJ
LNFIYRSPFLNLPCPFCKGRKITILNPCIKCGGDGIIKKDVELEISVPPFSSDTKTFVLKNEGNHGMYGGKNGDLYIKFKLKKHPFYTKKGLDLYAKIFLPKNKRNQENFIKIKNLKNETLIVKIPPNADNNILRITGEGFQSEDGKKGNIYITVDYT